MRKKLLATLMIATLCLAGCQSSTQADTPVETPTATTALTEAPKSTDETTPTETICPTEAPSSEERGDGPTLPEITEAPVISEEPVPTEVPVIEPTEEPISTEVLAEPTLVPTATVAPTATLVPTSTPVPTATPKPTKAPDLNIEISNDILWEGKDYPETDVNYGPQNGTITLNNIGTKIPLLSSFNEFALDKDSEGWLGNTRDQNAIIQDVLSDISKKMRQSGILSNPVAMLFSYTDDTIHWSWGPNAGKGFALCRNMEKDSYTLIFNRSLKKDEIYGVDCTAYNRDVVMTLCSIISAQPEVLFDALLKDQTGDVSISRTSYTTIGDCQVKVYDGSTKSYYVYYIRSATYQEPVITRAPDLNVEISDNIFWEGKDYPENDADYGPHNGTITLNNIGTKIPLLSSFNEFAIDEGNKGWIADKGAEEQILDDVLSDVRWALIDMDIISNHNQAFLYQNYAITWDWTMKGWDSDLELRRDPTTDTYTLIINRDLKSDYLSLMKADYAPYNRDIVKVFLSIFSSTPEEVFDYLYEGMYENAKLLSSSTYKSVGDCQIKMDKTFSFKDGKLQHIKFYFIAP